MRIDSSGNVGIGTTSPSYSLHVNRTGAAAQMAVQTNTTAAYVYSLYGSTVNTALISDSTTSYLSAETNNPLVIRTNATERMRIDSSGNVGIGTNSPASKLSFGGQSGATSTPLALRFAQDYSNTTVASACKIFLYNSGSSNDIYGFGVGSNSDVQYHAYQGAGNGSHNFYTENTLRMRIDGAGRVTKPYQPAFMAGIASTSDATIASSAYVPFNTVTGGFNTGSNFSTTNYYFTAPVAGRYFFTCALYLTNSSSATYNMQWGFYVNGAFKSFTSGDAYGVGSITPNSAGGVLEFATTAIFDLAANDTVGVRPRTANIRIYQGHCYFGGYFLG